MVPLIICLHLVLSDDLHHACLNGAYLLGFAATVGDYQTVSRLIYHCAGTHIKQYDCVANHW